MPSEVKQRKKTKQSDEVSETSSANKDEKKTEAGSNAAANTKSSSLDLKSIMCLLSLAACGALSWYVGKYIQNNQIFMLAGDFLLCPLLKVCLLVSGWCCNRMRGFPKLRKSTVFCRERLRVCSTWRKRCSKFLKRYV